MLPRLSFILAMFVLMLASPSQGLAEEKGVEEGHKPLFSFKTDDREPLFGDRFTLKVGYKVWVVNWEAQLGSTSSTTAISNNDRPAFLNGPTITGLFKLRDSQWFNAIAFNFTWMRDGVNFAAPYPMSDHFFANRRDYSLTASLAIWEGFGIFAGYYNSRQEITNAPHVVGFTPTRFPRTLEGPLIGVFGTIPATDRVSFYGNLAYAQLKYKGICFVKNFCAETDAAHGWMNEVGVTVQGPRAWKIGTELQMGFRAQIIRKGFGQNATGAGTAFGTNQVLVHDLTYGPIFTINAVF